GSPNSSPLRLKLISTVICIPGRDCSIGGGTQHASSAASRSVSVPTGACGFSAAALAESAAITNASAAICKRDLNIESNYKVAEKFSDVQVADKFSAVQSIEQDHRKDDLRAVGRDVARHRPLR